MALICGRLSGEPEITRAWANSPPLRQGARGEGVRVLQLALIDLGTPMPRSTANGLALPDGIYGTETAAAVTAFQRLNGLVADGIAGRQTLERLDALLAARGTTAAWTAARRGEKPKGAS